MGVSPKSGMTESLLDLTWTRQNGEAQNAQRFTRLREAWLARPEGGVARSDQRAKMAKPQMAARPKSKIIKTLHLQLPNHPYTLLHSCTPALN